MESGKDAEEERLLKSFGENFVLHVKKMRPGSPLPDPDVKDWYMVMYDCEYVGKALAEAMPVFMAQEEFDFFTMYKRFGPEGERKYAVSPRLFRKRVRLSGFSLVPDGNDLKSTTILDGYIFE
jgi:hypothetical protein